jgi:dUTP pyrophosphatase
MQVKIINKGTHPLPGYQTAQSAGMDLNAFLPDGNIILAPMQRSLVPTGLFIELPVGFEAQIRPRSGLAVKQGITCLNTPGTIDSDYRGEIKVLLINLSTEDQVIHDGDRIAQMIIAKHETITWELVTEISETDRGAGGFGSTGVKK